MTTSPPCWIVCSSSRIGNAGACKLRPELLETLFADVSLIALALGVHGAFFGLGFSGPSPGSHSTIRSLWATTEIRALI